MTIVRKIANIPGVGVLTADPYTVTVPFNGQTEERWRWKLTDLDDNVIGTGAGFTTADEAMQGGKDEAALRRGPHNQSELDAMLARQDAEGKRAMAERVALGRDRTIRAVTFAICRMSMAICTCDATDHAKTCTREREIATVAVDTLVRLGA